MFQKIYFLKNFNTQETLTFTDENISKFELTEYNEKGWNIYESVNTFIGNDRKSENIAEIKSCFVDIDYPEILNMDDKQRASFLKEKFIVLKSKLIEIKNLYNIEPNLINITYKGFHILFNYEESCYFINKEIHLKINNKINDILGGDENARDVSRVYKSFGFIDWKGGKKGIIKKFSSQDKSFISLEKIKNIVQEDIGFREITKLKLKTEKNQKRNDLKQSNIDKINSIDALEFLNKIEKTINDFEKNLSSEEIEKIKNSLKIKQTTPASFSLFEKDGKNLTSGLTIEKDSGGVWKINDYSKKTRRGNYNFLKNWVLKDINYDFKTFLSFIYNSTNIQINSANNKSQMSSKLLWDDHNQRLKLSSINNKISNPELRDAYISNVDFLLRNNGFKKIFRGLFIFLYENFAQDIDKNTNTFKFKMNSLLENSFGLLTKKQKDNHRKYIKEVLITLSGLTVPFEENLLVDGKKKTKVTFKHMMELSFETTGGGKNNFEFLEIKFLIPTSIILGNSSFTNKNILTYQSGFKNTKVTDLFIEIDDILNNTNHTYSKSLEKVFSQLEFTSSLKINKKNLKKHFDEAIQKKFFKFFKITKDTLLVSNFKIDK